ncbi:MAG: B12-binding domain-containing radical SAM protein [Thermodesulfobacteriota bacterium]
MRFLLVNPHYPISEGPSPPLGLAFIAAALEAAGIEVRILDLVVTPYSRELLESELNSFRPQVIGATAVTMTVDNALRVLGDARELDADILTVMGGPHVTFCAEATMERFPFIDLVVLGEGEKTVAELMRAARNGRNFQEVAGVVCRNGNRLVRTPAREALLDVDSLNAPARHLLSLGRYRALGMPISMTTSRGCPHQCIFCVGRKMVGAKVRYRGAQSVVDELEYLGSLGFPQINIADDLFTANKKHCIGICDEILRRNLKIKWSSFARVDTVSPEVLGKMHAAGCDSVSFGVETANAGILKTIRKGITTDQVIAAVRMCNDAGIQPSASFILGLPGETPETIEETVSFGKKLREMGVIYGFHLLAPFPGTRVREECEHYGIRILTDDWREYHANRAIVETAAADKEMLDAIVIEWEKNIDLWLGDIGRRIQSGEATEEEAFPLKNLERTVAVYDLMMDRAIETCGKWATDGRPASDEEGLRELVARVKDRVPHSPERLYDALQHAFQKGNLSNTRENGTIQWQWVEHL